MLVVLAKFGMIPLLVNYCSVMVARQVASLLAVAEVKVKALEGILAVPG
jgi:hypothetical protein